MMDQGGVPWKGAHVAEPIPSCMVEYVISVSQAMILIITYAVLFSVPMTMTIASDTLLKYEKGSPKVGYPFSI